MAISIPSPVLARLQIMFASGATLEEVAEALEFEFTDGPATAAVVPSPDGRDRVEIATGLLEILRQQLEDLGQIEQSNDPPDTQERLNHIYAVVQGLIDSMDAPFSEPAGAPPSADAIPERKKPKRRSPESKSAALEGSPSDRQSSMNDTPFEALKPAAAPPMPPVPGDLELLPPDSDLVAALFEDSEAFEQPPAPVAAASANAAPIRAEEPSGASVATSGTPNVPSTPTVEKAKPETAKRAGRKKGKGFRDRMADVVSEINVIAQEQDDDDETQSALR